MASFRPSVKQLKNKGKIKYEYNPFRNYRNDNGEIEDLKTDKLKFNLQHPVDIECQPSYDGSVNLIINDGLNSTKLINSRFSVRQNNTYEIVDRTGSNDTNLYDASQFDIDTSLYKKINTIPEIQFLGLAHGGNLPVGNYNFYFKYCDADGNETDFIGETGNVVCHIGNLNDPRSIRSGLENENSGKIVQFYLTNLDSAYDYIKVYYTRQTSSAHYEPTIEAKRLFKKFKNKGSVCVINITGFEAVETISIEEINKEYFLADTAKSAAQCKNRLFLANLTKPSIDYQDFVDISLRMLPEYDSTSVIQLDERYEKTQNGDYLYYDVKNIYNKVGYWEEEIYRLGVVYILSDNSLSPVFNIRGAELTGNTKYFNYHQKKDNSYIKPDDYNNLYIYEEISNTWEKTDKRAYIEYDEETGLIGQGTGLENAKGVIRIKESVDNAKICHLKIKIPSNVIAYMKDVLKIKGFFFVRQKRVPNILTQALVIGHDSISGIPLIGMSADDKITYKYEGFTDRYGILTNSYSDRLQDLSESEKAYANNEVAICPDYSIRQEYYNNFFTDTDFIVKEITRGDLIESEYNIRHYKHNPIETAPDDLWRTVPIIGVPDSIPTKRTELSLFCSRAGSGEDLEFKTVGEEFELDYSSKDTKYNIVRGAYSPYLGLSGYKGNCNSIINIYTPNYSEARMKKYFEIRYEDQSPYYASTERIDINNCEIDGGFYIKDYIYRGDCYICQYTHRLNRNFVDLNAPTADRIVDSSCWRANYKPETNPEEMSDINIGDLNAVQLGSWITFTVKSNYNLSMRDEDSSYVEEALIMGNNRSFYPLTEMSVDGNYKIPESSVINTGISSQTSQRVNFAQPDVPYLKNSFQTRIAYSDVSVTDAFKNGYRTFQGDSYQDYPTTYGGIMKILEVNDQILVIFEHGIGLLAVNERVVAGSGIGGDVFINSNKVLPDTINMITTDYGSQWPDSVIKTPKGVYGLDTVAKKMWRYSNGSIELLSDFKVQEFLNKNITLTERELTPIIGVRNVKTHYNAFKKDVMFTFYDNLNTFEETAWNLCYNELTGAFTTFYSWIPSYSENIDNIFFSFDRDTSKKISKLATSLQGNGNADGICYDSDYKLYLVNRPLPKEGLIVFTIERDKDKNYLKASFTNETKNPEINNGSVVDWTAGIQLNGVTYLNIKAEVIDTSTTPNSTYATYTDIIYFDVDESETIKKPSELTTDFWKHGQAGIIDIQEKIEPCKWYGKQHPFEFEFVVNQNPDKHKTFDNLQIISNKTIPESYHYEVVGDSYEFAEDKPNMYFRQEATKALYQYNGSDVTYDHNFGEVRPIQRKIVSGKYDKSTVFPAYYYRKDSLNSVEDTYHKYTEDGKNFNNLSGAEVVRHRGTNEFSIWNHCPAIDMADPLQGRLRGNTHYREDQWYVQINPLQLVQKNEEAWTVPPIAVSTSLIPNDITSVSANEVPEVLINAGYPTDVVSLDDGTNWSKRKEAKIKDKYMKCRIRYKGDKLALITGVKTLYRI